MYIVTGGAGFIGSAMVWELNNHGIQDILVVDLLKDDETNENLKRRKFTRALHRDSLFPWLDKKPASTKIEAVIHMGACSSTTEMDVDYLTKNNVEYSQKLWRYCTDHEVPFIYASSAATYGSGSLGFSDEDALTPQLKPLNPYGWSKQQFDAWVLQQKSAPPSWVGLRFFNVYGPQEYHKGGQSSVINHFVPQVKKTKTIRLFASARPDIADGEQKRDFVYVKDCTALMWHLIQNSAKVKSGIYNCGTGVARTFKDVAATVFQAMNHKQNIEFIPTPEALVEHYQYYTQAELKRLRQGTGFTAEFVSVETGVTDYVQNFLTQDQKYF